MQAPNNDRNIPVNPGLEMSPIPEEKRSSPDSGSLPDLIVEPAPDRHDDPPEFYEGLDRRMKQYYRQLFLGAPGSDDGTDDTPVHVHGTEFWSVSPIDVNIENDNMTTSYLNKRKTAPTDEHSPVKRRKRLTKGAHGSDDDSDDIPVHCHNTEFWSVSPIDVNIEHDNMTTSNWNKRKTAPTDENPPVKSRKRLTKGAHGSEDDISSDFEVNRSMASTFKVDIDTRKDKAKGDSIRETEIITSINSDDDYDESGTHDDVDEIEEIIDNKSFSNYSTQDFHVVSTTIAQIHEPRPERPQIVDGGSPVLIPRLKRFKRAVFGTNSVGRHSGQGFNVLLPSGAHGSEDDISSDFEVNRSMASAFKVDIDTRKDKAKGESIRETEIITSINSDDDYDESGTHDDVDEIEEIIDNKSVSNDSTQDFHIVSATIAQIHEPRPERPQMVDGGSPVLIPRLKRFKRAVFGTNSVGRHSGQRFNVLLPSGAHGSEDDISSDFEVNRSMASTFKVDIDTRKDKAKGDSIRETEIITSINSDDDYDKSGTHDDVDEIEEIIDNKSFSNDSTQDFHIVSTTIAQIHEPRPERPQIVDGGSPVLIPRLKRFKRAVFGTNSVGRHSGQGFNVLLPSDEITKTSLRQSFEDIEPVEMMREAVETRGNVSWHEEETSQASPTLAFEAPTSAKDLQGISTDSNPMNASHEESQAEFSEDSRVNKRKTAPTDVNPPVKKRKDAAVCLHCVEERKKWSHLNSDFFVGTPLVFKLCRCRDHECP